MHGRWVLYHRTASPALNMSMECINYSPGFQDTNQKQTNKQKTDRRWSKEGFEEHGLQFKGYNHPGDRKAVRMCASLSHSQHCRGSWERWMLVHFSVLFMQCRIIAHLYCHCIQAVLPVSKTFSLEIPTETLTELCSCANAKSGWADSLEPHGGCLRVWFGLVYCARDWSEECAMTSNGSLFPWITSWRLFLISTQPFTSPVPCLAYEESQTNVFLRCLSLTSFSGLVVTLPCLFLRKSS